MEEYEYKKSNREKAREANKSLFWCGCDANLVGQYGRCRVCGHVNKKKQK